MSVVYEIGDAYPVVTVHFDADGWEWFLQTVRSTLGETDTFAREVEATEASLAALREVDE